MKTARAKLKKLLDTLWSIAIRALYGNKCIVCGKTNNLAAHHCIVRKAQSDGVRWLKFNGVPLCWDCHMNHVHGNRADKAWLENYLRILDRLIPQQEQDKIRSIGHGITKYSIDDLRELVKTGWWAKEETSPIQKGTEVRN
jgi:hypothetical protein